MHVTFFDNQHHNVSKVEYYVSIISKKRSAGR